MIYEGVNKEGVHAFGLATSSDGVRWERSSDKPIFERSPPGRYCPCIADFRRRSEGWPQPTRRRIVSSGQVREVFR